MNNDLIERCPFCGELAFFGVEPLVGFVVCSGCDARGPQVATMVVGIDAAKTNAIVAWNKRAVMQEEAGEPTDATIDLAERAIDEWLATHDGEEIDCRALARIAVMQGEVGGLREALTDFDDGAGVAYTIAKLRGELDELYRRKPAKDAVKIRPGVVNETGPSIIGRLQQIDHLQRYQIAGLEHQLALALNPPKHKYWGAGEPDCPREIKAGNGELHTLRCKVCGVDDPRDNWCRKTLAASPPVDQGRIERLPGANGDFDGV